MPRITETELGGIVAAHRITTLPEDETPGKPERTRVNVNSNLATEPIRAASRNSERSAIRPYCSLTTASAAAVRLLPEQTAVRRLRECGGYCKCLRFHSAWRLPGVRKRLLSQRSGDVPTFARWQVEMPVPVYILVRAGPRSWAVTELSDTYKTDDARAHSLWRQAQRRQGSTRLPIVTARSRTRNRQRC